MQRRRACLDGARPTTIFWPNRSRFVAHLDSPSKCEHCDYTEMGGHTLLPSGRHLKEGGGHVPLKGPWPLEGPNSRYAVPP